MSDTPGLVTVDVEVGSGFEAGSLSDDAAKADIDFGVSSGMNADRIIKLITDLKAETVEALRSLLFRIAGVGEVKGLKIRLDGVEIGSARTEDMGQLREAINETLDELARHNKGKK